MTTASIIDTSRLRGRRGLRATAKGRPVDPSAVAQIRALLGDAPRRRDLLIEHLHSIQDHYGCLTAAHLVALAQEMRLAMAEVHEVATFYHHFDVVGDDDPKPPAITIRVCETLSCAMAGSQRLRDGLEALALADVRIIGAPCVGLCEQAPVAVVGRNPVVEATIETVGLAARERCTEPMPEKAIDLAAYQQAGGYRTLVECSSGARSVETVIAGGFTSSSPTTSKWR